MAERTLANLTTRLCNEEDRNKRRHVAKAPIHREEAEDEEEEEIAVDFAAATEVPDSGNRVSLHLTKGTREETEDAGIATTSATGRKNAVS